MTQSSARLAWAPVVAAAALDAAFVLARPGLPRAPLALALAVLGSSLGAALLAHLFAWCFGAVGALVSRFSPRNRTAFALVLGALVGALGAAGAFSGAGVRRSGLGTVLSVSTVVASVVAAFLASRHAPRINTLASSRPARGALTLGAVAAYLAHALVYPRQYALLHALAATAALTLSSAAAPARSRWRPSAPLVLATLVALAGLGFREAARAHVRRAAPLAQYALAALGPAYRLAFPPPAAQLTDRAGPRGPSLALGGADLVLLTVDALRADRLGAYGGPAGLTPAMDALAREGAVVERAYCTTPHTSYSLASLITGKYFREVSALGSASRPHDTLATLLRARGYETAAFFPPAVFFVDADRLGALRTEGFGFHERHEEYAPADERARQVEELLARTPRNKPLLLWVHFFEPHEPYEPHGSLRTDAPPRARYDSEVAAVDTAIAQLRASFARHGRRAAWVVTADHGEEFGEHGGRFHGTTLFDEQLRVPLVIAAPGLAPRRVPGPASLVDVLPTVLAGAGVAVSERARGHDLGPWLLGARSDSAGPVFASVGALRMVSDGARKLVCDTGDASCELFDLGEDPRERNNLIDQRPTEATRLRALLEGWSGSHGGFERASAAVEPPAPPCLERALQGERAVARELAATLPSLHGATRRSAIEALASLGDEDPAVRDALFAVSERAPDPANARAASVALARLGDRRGLDDTRASLASSDPRESLSAALGLARLGDAAGWARLEAAARDASEPEERRDAAVTALETLGAAEHDRALALWSSLLNDPRLGPRAARALGALHDPSTVPALHDALGVTPYALTRQALLEALAPLDPATARADLTRALAAPEVLPDIGPLLATLAEPGGTLRGAPTVDRAAGALRRSVALRGPGVRGPAVLYVQWERAADDPQPATLAVESVIEALEGARGWARFDLPRAPATVRLRSSERLRLGPFVLVAARR